MDTKTVTVIGRGETDIEEQEEKIMEQLSIPNSDLINMLDRQIMMEKGLQQAREGNTRPARDVFVELRQEICLIPSLLES